MASGRIRVVTVQRFWMRTTSLRPRGDARPTTPGDHLSGFFCGIRTAVLHRRYVHSTIAKIQFARSRLMCDSHGGIRGAIRCKPDSRYTSRIRCVLRSGHSAASFSFPLRPRALRVGV